MFAPKQEVLFLHILRQTGAKLSKMHIIPFFDKRKFTVLKQKLGNRGIRNPRYFAQLFQRQFFSHTHNRPYRHGVRKHKYVFSVVF